MNINASVTLLVDADCTKLEIHDDDARVKFLEIEITPEQLSHLLSRRAEVKIPCELKGLENVGKKIETDKIEFEIPESLYWGSHDAEKNLSEAADKACPEGWRPDHYFGSKDSFFQNGGKYFAWCTIRRWVEK